MQHRAPKTTKGVVIQRNPKIPPTYGELPMPPLTDDHILIKIHSAPINPSDQLTLLGIYQDGKPRPTTAGFEGSGLVIAAGNSPQSQALLNKRVCFMARGPAPGSWSEYTIVKNHFAYPLPPNMSYEQGATCLVNPLTVQAFINICNMEGYKSMAHTAAASQVGMMLIQAAKKAGIVLINFVRREGQVKILKDLGAEYVINRGEKGWKKKAYKLLKEHDVKVFFDALAGPEAGEVIRVLPDGATTYNYGVLTGKELAVSSTDLIFRKQIVRGYWLSWQLANLTTAKTLFQGAFENLATGVFDVKIAAKFPQERFQEALDYYAKNMSKGKVLIQNANFLAPRL